MDDFIIVVGRLSKSSEVDEIVRYSKISYLETPIYGANSVRGDDSLSPELVKSVDVCMIIHLVWRNGMMQAMTGQKRNRFSINITN